MHGSSLSVGNSVGTSFRTKKSRPGQEKEEGEVAKKGGEEGKEEDKGRANSPKSSAMTLLIEPPF